jgi:hypothetical protein
MLVDSRVGAVFPAFPDRVAPQVVDRKVGEGCQNNADGKAPQQERKPDVMDASHEPFDGDVFRSVDAGPAQHPVSEQIGTQEYRWNRERVCQPDKHQANRDIGAPENRARNDTDHLQRHWYQRPENTQRYSSRNRTTVQMPEIRGVEMFTKELQEPVIPDRICIRAVAFDELFWHYGSAGHEGTRKIILST